MDANANWTTAELVWGRMLQRIAASTVLELINDFQVLVYLQYHCNDSNATEWRKGGYEDA